MNGCRLCDCAGNELRQIARFQDIPIKTQLLNSAGEALAAAVGDLTIFHCPHCGLIQQRDFLPLEMFYEDTVNYIGNWRFQPHLDEQLAFLKKYTKLQSCLEIGSANGSFLQHLAAAGMKKLVGVDANKTSVATPFLNNIAFINGFFDEKTAADIAAEYGKFEILASRHVMEHLTDFAAFFRSAEIILDKESFIFTEVPNFAARHTPLACVYTSMAHEHLSFFTADTLVKLFNRHGYKYNLLVREPRCGGVLYLLSSKNIPLPESENTESWSRPEEIAGRLSEYSAQLRRQIIAAKNRQQKIAFYGAGSHGLIAMHSNKIADQIDLLIDDVKDKQGLFLPRCAMQIKPVSAVSECSDEILLLLALHPEWEESAIERLARYCAGKITVQPILSKRPAVALRPGGK